MEIAPVDVPVAIFTAKLDDSFRPMTPPVEVRAASLVIPLIPVITPVVEISQSLELMATVAELLPKVVTPVDERVVKAPVLGVVAPMAVLLIPVVVVVKLPAVTVRLLAPKLREEADMPERERPPLVAVRLRAPVVSVKPLLAVRVELNWPVPTTSRSAPGVVVPIPTFPFWRM
jgi:hypothetical protein